MSEHWTPAEIDILESEKARLTVMLRLARTWQGKCLDSQALAHQLTAVSNTLIGIRKQQLADAMADVRQADCRSHTEE